MESTLRTLLLTDRYLPEVGGSFVWFSNTYRRYPAGSVWIATQAYPDASEADAAFPGIRTVRMSLRRYRFLKPESLLLFGKLAAAALWIVQRKRIRILHAGKFHPEGVVARFVSKLTGVPYVVYAHSEELTVVLENPAYRSRLPGFRAVYNDASAVIANSDFTRNLLLGFGVRSDRIVRISPGVDPDRFRPGPKDPDLVRRHGLDGKTVLLSVGRLQKRKGHDFVLRALPAVLAEHPDVVYVIASDGEERPALEQLVRELGIEENVRFVGPVPEASLPAWYNTCDIFLMANRRLASGDVEGFGIVFLEASACGKPVIAGESGGTADSVRHERTGLRIDASDPRNIARAILRLVGDDRLARQLGENGRQLAESEYDWNVVAGRIRSLDESLVNGQPSGATASTGARLR